MPPSSTARLLLIALALLLALPFTAPARPAPVPALVWADTAPRPRATLTGPVPLAVMPPPALAPARVEYRLNGRPIASATTPFQVRWQSLSAWDGSADLQAVALDAHGRTLAQTPPRPVTINNTGHRLRLLAPDPAQTLRGTVTWRVAAESDPATPPSPANTLYFLVDGKPLDLKHDATTASVALDTTALANGKHELTAIAFAGPDADHLQPLAMSQVHIAVDNANTVRALRPRFSDLYLTPGQSVLLSPHLLHADGTSTLPAAVTFASDNPAAATVDAAGLVRYVSPGLATVTLRAQGFSATARVSCALSQQLPHFSTEGHLLTAYDPQHSLFVRTLFNLGPEEIAATPGLADAAHAAAINTLTSGFYSNPADNPADSFNQWKQSWLPQWQRMVRTAADHHFSLLLQGDDIARTHGELLNSITNPWSRQAIQFALTQARDAHRVIGIEMIDEINGVYGDSPTPTDGRWKTPAPPVPDDAFVSLMMILNGVSDRPRVTWPASAIASDAAVKRWNDPAFSDYASHYWDTFDFARAYAQGTSIAQEAIAMRRTIHQRRPLLPPDRPQLMEVSLTGPFYVKQGPGHAYTPGQDRLIDPGADPRRVASQIMRAVALGASGIRAYGFDGHWGPERQAAPTGQTVQTGANPLTGVGADRWAAMSAAFNLIQSLQPYLLQAQMNALDLGPDLTTAARQAPGGRLFLAVSDSEVDQTVNIDLGPYRYPNGTITRYTLNGADLRTDSFPATDRLTQSIPPGATIVYIFTPAPPIAPLAPPSSRLVPRSADQAFLTRGPPARYLALGGGFDYLLQS